jgi:hypothetical protein
MLNGGIADAVRGAWQPERFVKLCAVDVRRLGPPGALPSTTRFPSYGDGGVVA